MSRYSLDRALVLDLELTCWDGPPPAGMRPEIIEIGVVDVDVRALSIRRSASFLTIPVRSTISDYCAALTGITPERMKREGRPFPEVLRTLAKTFGPARKTMLTWGDDWTPIDEACREYGVNNPFPAAGALDVGRLMVLAMGAERRPGLLEMLESVGLEAEGRRHSGEGDAIDTARLFCLLAARTR